MKSVPNKSRLRRCFQTMLWTDDGLSTESAILEPASRGMVGVEADQNELSFAQNSKIELQISVG